jgi:hypothetical protein
VHDIQHEEDRKIPTGLHAALFLFFIKIKVSAFNSVLDFRFESGASQFEYGDIKPWRFNKKGLSYIKNKYHDYCT